MEFDELCKVAQNVASPWIISKHTCVGKVGAAILTDKGNVYKGVSIETPCSMGFCAEHGAISAMLTAGENRVVKLVAYSQKYGIVAPCGRCREFIYQINRDNIDCKVLLKDRVTTIDELLPDRWK